MYSKQTLTQTQEWYTHKYTPPCIQLHSEQQRANAGSDELDVRWFLCLCWCYRQMNTVQLCSQHAPVRSARRWLRRDYFSKAATHTTFLSPFINPLSQSFLPFNTLCSQAVHPARSSLLPSNFTFSHICCVALIFLPSRPSFDFLFPHLNRLSFLVPSVTHFLPQSHSLFSAG